LIEVAVTQIELAEPGLIFLRKCALDANPMNWWSGSADPLDRYLGALRTRLRSRLLGRPFRSFRAAESAVSVPPQCSRYPTCRSLDRRIL